MARYTLSLLQVLLALAAHQVAAVPVVLPLPSASLPLPSGWTSNLPLPTGAKLDPAVHAPRDQDVNLPSLSLTSLPTGTFNLSTLSLTLPTTVDLSTLSLTLPSLTQLPTTLPGSLSLSIDLPTGLSTLTLDKRTLSVPIATATGIPSTLPGGLPPLPTGFPTGLPPPALPTGAPEYPGGLLQPDN